MIDSGIETKPITNVYHGSTDPVEHARGVKRCETAWNKDRYIGTFDDLLFTQLQAAKNNRRREVNVLDIGSGDATLYREFLNNPLTCPKTRDFLSNNTDVRMNLIGLTDASLPTEIFTQDELNATNNVALPNVSARNIKYSLTAKQTLKDFIQHEKIEQIDLITATWALTYMGTNTFEQAMSNAINSLRPHSGFMVAAAYAEQEISGFRRPDPSLPHELDIGCNENSKPSSLKMALADDHMRFYREGVNLAEEEESVTQAEELLLKLGVLEKETIEGAKTRYYDDLREKRRDGGGALSIRATETITMSLERLARKKAQELKLKKQAIVRELEKKYDKIAEITLGETTITVRKK